MRRIFYVFLLGVTMVKGVKIESELLGSLVMTARRESASVDKTSDSIMAAMQNSLLRLASVPDKHPFSAP